MKAPFRALFLPALFISAMMGPAHLLRADEAPARETVHALFITLDETVDTFMLDTFERRLKSALEAGPPPRYIVLEVDTWGGYVDAAVDIAHLIDEIPKRRGALPDERTEVVCFITKKAISAGALIAIACKKIVMRETAELGDAAPVMQHPEEGMKMLGEKAQAPVRKKFMAYAEKNGYPEAIAMAMVSVDLEVLEVQRKEGLPTLYVLSEDFEHWTDEEKARVERTLVVVKKGELATLTASEAQKYGFCKHIADTRDELLKKLALEDEYASVVPVYTHLTWWEVFVYFLNLPAVQGLLMLLAVAGIGIDLKSGFGTGGIGMAVGITALAILIASGYMTGLTNVIDVVIIAVGLVLLGVEVFILPGFGVVGFLGILCLAAGLVLSLQTFTVPEVDWQFNQFFNNIAVVIGGLGFGTLGLALFARYLPHVGPFQRLVHSATEAHDAGYASQTSGEQALVGKTGTASTKLRPAGKADIEGNEYDVVSEGAFLDAGSAIVVIQVDGNRIVVAAFEMTEAS